MNTTRRRLLMHATYGTVLAVSGGSPFPTANAHSNEATVAYRRIRSVVRRDDTIHRHKIYGDIFPLTWTADDRQFSSISDGLLGSSNATKNVNTGGMWVGGTPTQADFREIASYPHLLFPKDYLEPGPDSIPLYYGFGALAIKKQLYHFLCTRSKISAQGRTWNGVKLIYSPDQGKTWHNQDGSKPVVWNSYANQSRKTLLFFEESQRAFSLVSLLQMGKAYTANQDGYVYGYGTNGNTDGTMNQLVMFRVPIDRILNRNAYEFFGGMKGKDEATWVNNIEQRAIVHSFPSGWVNTPRDNQGVVQAWVPSVVYIPAVGQYLMVCSGIGCPPDGNWYENPRPSYLGFWTAPNPWGPWSQVYENSSWTPGNDPAAVCYSPQIAPKWIAADGKSFWLVWSDYQEKKCDANEGAQPCRPYYIFNTQRFDIIL